MDKRSVITWITEDLKFSIKGFVLLINRTFHMSLMKTQFVTASIVLVNASTECVKHSVQSPRTVYIVTDTSPTYIKV